MRFRTLARVASSMLLSTLAVAQSTPQSEQHPLTKLPYTPALNVESMNKSVSPCADFYTFSCGGWMKQNPIPPEEPRWSVYGKLANENKMFLWGILNEVARPAARRMPIQQKIGDLFASCMDEVAVDKSAAKPLKPFLVSIERMKSTRDLPAVLASLHLDIKTFGWTLMFGVGSNQDYGDSTQVIAFANAGGLGPPDRDYYLKEDAKSQEIRSKYSAHVQGMFQLLGDDVDAAHASAKTVLEIETELAKASLTRVERRDPYKQYHKMNRAQLQALMPSFAWNRYFEGIGLPDIATVNVTQPEFFKQWEHLLVEKSLADLKTYLRWHVVHAEAPYLSSKFVQSDFDFYARTLRGTQQLQPRWKRCVSTVDQLLGEALGQEFVNRTFPPEMRKRTLEMAKQIEAALEEDITQLTWMGPATKKEALQKLHSIVNKVGYPDTWRDYSSVKIARGNFLGNVTRAARFEKHRQLVKIGRPVDRGEWNMTPPTVNAYYSPQLNDINFPAGILQPPLYDFKLDDAPNYGNTGSTIGHELTHGFDDQGRKFDAKGNLIDWWTREDAEQFEKRASCISDEYAQFVVVDDVHINSKLTLGEDVADLGGAIVAWTAWRKATLGQTLEPRDGFSPEQRFFIGMAQWACENQRPEDLRLRAITDPHSPGKYRVNGLVANMPEFQQAFSCKPDEPMAPTKRCRVW